MKIRTYCRDFRFQPKFSACNGHDIWHSAGGYADNARQGTVVHEKLKTDNFLQNILLYNERHGIFPRFDTRRLLDRGEIRYVILIVRGDGLDGLRVGSLFSNKRYIHGID